MNACVYVVLAFFICMISGVGLDFLPYVGVLLVLVMEWRRKAKVKGAS